MAVITEDAIRELAAFRGQDAPVTSIYLDVDGRRFVRHQDYEHELDLLLKTAREKAAGVSSVNDDLDKIGDYVRAGFDRSTTRGLAFFSCSAQGLFEVVALPVPVRNSVILNSAPAVGQLELFAQDYNRFGVLLVDKQRARMLVFEFGELSDHSELYEELPRDYDARGQHDQGYDREQHHVDELAAQHVRHAAQVAFHVFQERGFEHLTIGASDAIAHDLEAHLHQYLRDRLVGRISVSTSSSLDDIRRAAFELETEVDRREEAEVVSKLRDAVGSGQKGVAELEPVLRALGEHRVERLIVSEGFVESGWRCPSCHVLATIGRACPVCSTDMDAIDDVVEEAVEAALAGGVKVDICVGNADLDVLGRVGALLRY